MALGSVGYVYVPDEEMGPLSQAFTASVVCNQDRLPPYIVVSHSIEDVLVAKWPGKLWRVTNIDSEGIEQVSQNAHYTRAVAVTICDEVPVYRLFGEHGAAVCSVISRASQLDMDLVQALADSRHPDSGDAYLRAWARWWAEWEGNKEYVGQNLAGTLSNAGYGKKSPINYGFSVLCNMIRKRAESLVGSRAFLDDDDDDDGKYFEPTWESACGEMMHAAMAMGAPQLSRTEDRLILLAAWRAVYGDSECTL